MPTEIVGILVHCYNHHSCGFQQVRRLAYGQGVEELKAKISREHTGCSLKDGRQLHFKELNDVEFVTMESAIDQSRRHEEAERRRNLWLLA